jgi:Flp pilus assembly protein TadB
MDSAESVCSLCDIAMTLLSACLTLAGFNLVVIVIAEPEKKNSRRPRKIKENNEGIAKNKIENITEKSLKFQKDLIKEFSSLIRVYNLFVQFILFLSIISICIFFILHWNYLVIFSLFLFLEVIIFYIFVILVSIVNVYRSIEEKLPEMVSIYPQLIGPP